MKLISYVYNLIVIKIDDIKIVVDHDRKVICKRVLLKIFQKKE